MPEVDSTALKAIDYRPLEHQLVLKFSSGELYAYDQASEDLYHRFLAAPSKGRFFQAEVRGRLPFRKLKPKP
ncbi:MAG TPA: KTSC domain-containing protein [Caulobacteraceae bacterium]|jgi:lysyl-tRNA synthetase class 2|nr:KTSC domain-containing protein [Caulobacteraceae bacterium]